MDFDAMAGQCLLRVEVFEPWREFSSHRHASKGASLLCGVVADRKLTHL
jgi:hypothetical protein